MIERRKNDALRMRQARLTFVDRDGIPWAVQEIAVNIDGEGIATQIVWRDCVGRVHTRPVPWVLGHKFTAELRTRDQLYVCRNYARYVLERDVARWWEPIT
jgi:hypothetical protein